MKNLCALLIGLMCIVMGASGCDRCCRVRDCGGAGWRGPRVCDRPHYSERQVAHQRHCDD